MQVHFWSQEHPEKVEWRREWGRGHRCWIRNKNKRSCHRCTDRGRISLAFEEMRTPYASGPGIVYENAYQWKENSREMCDTFQKHLYHQVHQTIQWDKPLFASDAHFPSSITNTISSHHHYHHNANAVVVIIVISQWYSSHALPVLFRHVCHSDHTFPSWVSGFGWTVAGSGGSIATEAEEIVGAKCGEAFQEELSVFTRQNQETKRELRNPKHSHQAKHFPGFKHCTEDFNHFKEMCFWGQW